MTFTVDLCEFKFAIINSELFLIESGRAHVILTYYYTNYHLLFQNFILFLFTMNLIIPYHAFNCNFLLSSVVFRDKDCRFYDSKMRPLLMVYESPDPSASPSDIRVIFKNGDGKVYVCVCIRQWVIISIMLILEYIATRY